jgi:hypothetical protein
VVRGLTVVLAGLIVSACVPNEGQFDVAEAKRVSGRPRTVEECTRINSKRLSRNQKENLAALMMVSVEQVPEVFCRRTLAAFANGRLSLEEAKAAAMNRPSINLIRILQDR